MYQREFRFQEDSPFWMLHGWGGRVAYKIFVLNAYFTNHRPIHVCTRHLHRTSPWNHQFVRLLLISNLCCIFALESLPFSAVNGTQCFHPLLDYALTDTPGHYTSYIWVILSWIDCTSLEAEIMYLETLLTMVTLQSWLWASPYSIETQDIPTIHVRMPSSAPTREYSFHFWNVCVFWHSRHSPYCVNQLKKCC